ncbi:hypothetical protein [Vibrio mimicus]|uniref:hypothetical protein n=1 Tax=Vibrio mimicus TaxID=674 RepID=UPI001CA372D4|nr:hypothetical protein [Vibrio mimicus]
MTPPQGGVFLCRRFLSANNSHKKAALKSGLCTHASGGIDPNQTDLGYTLFLQHLLILVPCGSIQSHRTSAQTAQTAQTAQNYESIPKNEYSISSIQVFYL